MLETTDTPPPVPEGPKIASVMDRLRTLSAKPAELKHAALDRIKGLRAKSNTDPRGALEELAGRENAIVSIDGDIEAETPDVPNDNPKAEPTMTIMPDGIGRAAQRLKDFAADDNSGSGTRSKELDVATATPIDISLQAESESKVALDDQVESRIIDPEAEYQRVLGEIRTENKDNEDPYSVFQKFIRPDTDEKPETTPRKFNALDKARHQILALDARRQGVTDIEAFNRLVESLEINLSASNDELDRVHLRHDYIPALKAILDTGVDPVRFIEALFPHTKVSEYMFCSRWLTSEDSKIKDFIQLLSQPNATALLPVMKGISRIPRMGHVAPDDYFKQLISIAESGEIPHYPPEFFDKVNIIAQSLRIHHVDIKDLPAWERLIGDPNRINLIASAMRTDQSDACFSESATIFEALDSLEYDGLLVPLNTLMTSGIKIGTRSYSNHYYVSYSRSPQNEIETKLSALVHEPSSETILAHPDMQDFAQVLNTIGRRSVSAKEVVDLFEHRQDFVALNQLVFGSRDAEYKSKYYNDDKVVELQKLLVGIENRKKIILSPDFQDFIANLRKRGISIGPHDYFTYGNDIFDQNNTSDQSVLVQLFQARDLVEIIDPEMHKRIIEGNRAEYKSSEREIGNHEWERLGKYTRYASTIKLLQDASVPITTEKLEIIAQIANMPLLNYKVRDRVPEDKKTEWTASVLNLPYEFQYGVEAVIGESLQAGKQAPELTAEELQKVNNLSELFSTSSFLRKEAIVPGPGATELCDVLVHYRGDVVNLFTNGQPNADFAKALIEHKYPAALSLILNEDILASFEGDARSALEAWLDFPHDVRAYSLKYEQFPALSTDRVNRYQVAANIIHFVNMDRIPEINKLIGDIISSPNYMDFIKDGRPTRFLTDEIIKQRGFRNLAIFLSSEVLLEYDDNERSVLAAWMSLPNDIRAVLQEVPEFPQLAPGQVEKCLITARLIDRIRSSPSVDIKRIEKELIGQLWQLDNPQAAMDEIIYIFEHNNLPPVGKIYRVFETIYDNPGPNGTILENDLAHNRNLSPELIAASPRRRRDIIYRDLLSIHIGSANPQLRDYLEVIRQGEGVVAKLETQGSNNLTQREQELLDHFFNKMDVLYSSSLFGRSIENRRRVRNIDSTTITTGMNIEDRLRSLRSSFRVRSDQRLTNRLSEMFLQPIGYDSIDSVLEEMDRIKTEADSRNREFVTDDKIELKAGDRFKGVNFENFGKILERGVVAREYLGSSAGSDRTPYDTDTVLILEEDLTNGVESALKVSPATGYGEITLVVRDRGQFGQNKYESFASHVVGVRHYGIRTGLPSSEIDAVIANETLISDDRRLDDLYMSIAQQGMYIPVCTADGTVIFSPEKYDEYRKTFDGVSEYSSVPVSVRRVGNDEGNYSFPDTKQVTETTRATLDQLASDIRSDRERVQNLSHEIRQRLSESLAQLGVTLRGEFDTSIYGAQLVDTGSTSRGVNLPGDYDFDLSLQLDPNDIKRLGEISEAVKRTLRLQEDRSHTEADYVQVRAIGSEVIEGETLDIDVGIGKRADDGIFASSDAVTQKYESIRTDLGEEAYDDVLANVVLAKQILKAGHAYKKFEDGGLGGIGVENWILHNNGNVLDAFQSFWDASHNEEGGTLSYEEFAAKYKIFDAGTNIKFNRHDNFARVLKSNGYSAMIDTIGKYLGYL